MREGKINLPVVDNDGAALDKVHKALLRDIVAKFGGATVTLGEGAWAHDGVIYAEPVKVYSVAAEDTEANNFALADIAVKAGIAAKQLAVYCLGFDGAAEIINLN